MTRMQYLWKQAYGAIRRGGFSTYDFQMRHNISHRMAAHIIMEAFRVKVKRKAKKLPPLSSLKLQLM